MISQTRQNKYLTWIRGHTRKKKKRSFYEDRLEALRKRASRARAEMAEQQGSKQSITSEKVYG